MTHKLNVSKGSSVLGLNIGKWATGISSPSLN